ncbi:hypothetical protein DVS77_05540 [Mycolicibacterium moriokaense]|nr:hypothetical protein DVS77_05540 [Mycolicibacterium moriokaense]
MAALMAVVMVASTLARRWASARGRRVPRHPIGRFLAVKLALLGLAVAVAVALDGRLAHVDLWIAIGLFAVVSVVGPQLHSYLTAHSGEVRAGLTAGES